MHYFTNDFVGLYSLRRSRVSKAIICVYFCLSVSLSVCLSDDKIKTAETKI